MFIGIEHGAHEDDREHRCIATASTTLIKGVMTYS